MMIIIMMTMNPCLLCAYNINNISTAGSLREEGGRGHHEGPDRYDLMMMMEDRWREGQSG